MKKKQLIEAIVVWALVLGCLALAVIKPMKSGNGMFYFVAVMIAIFFGVYIPSKRTK